MKKMKRLFLFMGSAVAGIGLSLIGAPKTQSANPYVNMLASATFATDTYAQECFKECHHTGSGGSGCYEAKDEFWCSSGGGSGDCFGKLGCS